MKFTIFIYTILNNRPSSICYYSVSFVLLFIEEARIKLGRRGGGGGCTPREEGAGTCRGALRVSDERPLYLFHEGQITREVSLFNLVLSGG